MSVPYSKYMAYNTTHRNRACVSHFRGVPSLRAMPEALDEKEAENRRVSQTDFIKSAAFLTRG